MLSDDIIKAIATTPGTTQVVLAFNKTNGAFLGSFQDVKIEELTGEEYIHYEYIDYDPITQRVVGNYPDHKVVNIADLPKDILESQLDTMMATKITSVYPLAEQVNVLGRAIQTLAKEHGIVLDELEEMLDYIKTVRETNREHKEAYRNDPAFNYISNDDLKAQADELYAGGLHEALGPREIQGGRVFH